MQVTHALHISDRWTALAYVQLQGKTDARFVEAAFKIFRDKFGLRPVITAAQFLEQARLLRALRVTQVKHLVRRFISEQHIQPLAGIC